MASLCSGVRSSPSTPPWCLQSGATGRLDVSAQQSAEQPWTKREGGRSGLTPSWRSSTVVPGWWFWAARWGDDGPKSHGNSWLHLRQPRRGLSQNSWGSPPCSAGFVGGAPSWLAPLLGLSPSPCCSEGAARPQMVPHLRLPRCWRATSGTWSEFGDRRLRCVLHDFCDFRGLSLCEKNVLTILGNLAKLVKIFPGIIVRRHHTDQKRMGLLRERTPFYVTLFGKDNSSPLTGGERR